MTKPHAKAGNGHNRVSLIICTKNRIGFLRETLSHLLPSVHHKQRLFEILIVDNGYSDGTSEMVSTLCTQWSKVRYVFCSESGLSRARNKAISLAEGGILVWTDDDIIIDTDWMENLIHPIDTGEAECVVGRVEIAPHLHREWMKPFHRLWLAENINPLEPQLIGANMAIRKSCFEGGMAFDPQTGPGALGYMDDTLLGMRLRKSGMRIVYKDEARVVHHFSEERLRRVFWIRTAKAAGRSTAYVAHHWEHGEIILLWPRLFWQWLKLWILLFHNHCRGAIGSEGIDDKEFAIRKTISYLEGMCSHQKTPFNY
jgi:glycosyltransferase involved in cell wall biosynthesis